MAYLDEHRPASPQFREPRRERISGIVFVHTAEGVQDDVGPDSGAENVAGFISRRTDPGSYHVLVDSDSDIDVVRDECEAFQVAANGHNRHGWGISFACRTTDLDPDDPWTQAAMARAGRKIREFWQRHGFDPVTSARWITKGDADARRMPGLCCHGTAQPADRTDAWSRHPRRAELERMLIVAITGANVPAATPEPEESEEDDVKQYIVWDHRTGRGWHVFGNTKVYLANGEQVDALRKRGVEEIPSTEDNAAWLDACATLNRNAGGLAEDVAVREGQ